MGLPLLASFVLPSGPRAWGALVAAYALGSVPFGLFLGRLRGVDVRKRGSGNIGATNVGRALGRPFAYLAFGLDFLKGWVPAAVLAPWAAAPGSATTSLAVLSGAAAVLGHCFPVTLGFRGGKGVSTACGAVVAIDPVVFVAGGLAWVLVLFTTHFVGLASIAMGCTFPLAAWFRRGPAGYGNEVVLGACGLTVLILFRHRANIARMLRGEEPRSGRHAPPEEKGDGTASKEAP